MNPIDQIESIKRRTPSIVERARLLDAAIADAGGLGPFWIRYEQAKHDRGEAYCTTLIDPATDEVVAAWNDRTDSPQ